MKLHCSTLLTACLFAFGTLTARAEVYDLSTVAGKTYHQCRVLKIELDGVSFKHANGIAKVLFKDLTPQWRNHFGYDADKAKAHEVKLKEDKAKAREAAAKRAAEIAKAQQEAFNIAQDAATLQALQAAADSNQNMGYGYYGLLAITGGVTSPFITEPRIINGRLYHVSSRRGLGPLCNSGGARNWCSNSLGYANNGFTPRPFFAVPGIGPNVAMPAAPRCVGSMGSGIVR